MNRFILFLLAISIFSCDPMTFNFEEKALTDGSGPTEGPGEVPPENPPQEVPATFADVQAKILEPSCTGCHSGERPRSGINLETYEKIAAADGLLKAKSPTESLLFTVISSGFMPPRGEPVTPANLRVLAEWICRGALKEGAGEAPTDECMAAIPEKREPPQE